IVRMGKALGAAFGETSRSEKRRNGNEGRESRVAIAAVSAERARKGGGTRGWNGTTSRDGRRRRTNILA
ncbi:MAG: hypothetical protein IJE97_17710, partial [Thermoguttaceae bacterium]|nr:hypothetical protein [Thermoguttaceae bacterium]